MIEIGVVEVIVMVLLGLCILGLIHVVVTGTRDINRALKKLDRD